MAPIQSDEGRGGEGCPKLGSLDLPAVPTTIFIEPGLLELAVAILVAVSRTVWDEVLVQRQHCAIQAIRQTLKLNVHKPR